MTEHEQQAYIDGILSKVASAPPEVIAHLEKVAQEANDVTRTGVYGSGLLPFGRQAYGAAKGDLEGVIRSILGETAGAIGGAGAGAAGGAALYGLLKLLSRGKPGLDPTRYFVLPSAVVGAPLGAAEGAYQALKGMNKED